MAKPLLFVDRPSFTPLPHGLLDTLSSEIRSSDNPHWENGVRYEVLCASSDSTYDECLVVSGTGAAPAEPPSKSETAQLQWHGALPFTVYAEVDCSVPGFWDHAEESVRRAITQSEQREVERALWTGAAGGALVVHPHLASDTDVLDESTAMPPGPDIVLDTAATIVSGNGIVTTLGELEDALADCYDGVGVIHVPRRLAPALANINVLNYTNGKYITPNGNIVVLGSGYPGTGPDGTGTTWIYATGMPFIYRSVTRVFRPRDSIERATNTLYTIAELTYVIGWDCCHLAAQVTLEG